MRASAGQSDVDLDVGVIYTHEAELMPPLLTSLALSAPGRRMRLLLVDNASEDGVERWRQVVPETTTISNPRRLGYAANLNRILSTSTAPFVLLLNTDVRFEPDNGCLSRMLDFMEQTPDCGLSTCAVFHADGAYAHPARGEQTWQVIAGRRLGLAWPLRTAVDRYLHRDRACEETFECSWVSGCFMFLRREVWRKVGRFDERFEKYFEDVDYAKRIWQAGYRVMHHGAARCIHDEQRASRRLLSRDGWQHLKSYLCWLHKWGFTRDKAA